MFLCKEVQQKNMSFQIEYSMNSLSYLFFFPLWIYLESEDWTVRTLKKPFLFGYSSSMADSSSRNVKVSEVYEESHRIVGNHVYSILPLLGVNGFTHLHRQEQEMKSLFCEAGHILFKLSQCFKHRELIMWGTVVFKYIFTKQDLPLLFANF